MAAPVAPVYRNPAERPGDMHREGCCAKLKVLVELIIQTVVRVLFIAASIVMAAAAFPLKIHALVLPVVAVGTTALAGFFFPEPRLAPARLNPMKPLLQPAAARPIAAAVPPDLIQEAPRPLVNIHNNCAFNSLVHFFQSDPTLAHWFRHPLTPGMDMAAFENFLAGYATPQQVVNHFRQYVNLRAVPHPSVPAMFKEFIDGHVPGPDYAAGFRHIKNTYNDLRLLQGPFGNFFAAYDRAIQDNLPVGTSQDLRLALNRITEMVDPSEGVQVDAAEPMNYVLDLLPNAQKLRISEETHYDTRGLSAIAGNPDGVVRKDERHGYIQVAIPENEEAPTLDRLIQLHFDDHTVIERKDVHGKDRPYPTTITRRFEEAPQALRIQIKRFYNQKPPASWLTKLKLFFWPELGWRMIKKEVPVQIPQELTISLANGERRQFRLASFVNHHGATIAGGHYTAACIINGRNYFMNDEEVTLPDQPAWDDRLQKAYLLCYLPVPAPAPAAAPVQA